MGHSVVIFIPRLDRTIDDRCKVTLTVTSIFSLVNNRWAGMYI
jgi:hypothetical protein